MSTGTRPAQTKIHRDVFAFHAPRDRSADTLRAALARITLNDALAKQLAVVGCRSHEGRSVVAANLAVLLAKSGQRTALIDAARQRPRQHQLFGIPSADTATDVPEVPGLSIITGTQTLPSLAETLIDAPTQFARAMATLGGEYGYIVIDTAAHPDHLDAISAGTLSDGALVVVQRDVTPLQRLRTLTDRLQDSGTNVLGTLLTDG